MCLGAMTDQDCYTRPGTHSGIIAMVGVGQTLALNGCDAAVDNEYGGGVRQEQPGTSHYGGLRCPTMSKKHVVGAVYFFIGFVHALLADFIASVPPRLTLSPSLGFSAQNDNDDNAVNAASVRNA